jgi:hypothetical protein
VRAAANRWPNREYAHWDWHPIIAGGQSARRFEVAICVSGESLIGHSRQQAAGARLRSFALPAGSETAAIRECSHAHGPGFVRSEPLHVECATRVGTGGRTDDKIGASVRSGYLRPGQPRF